MPNKELRVFEKIETNPLANESIDSGKSSVTFKGRFWFSSGTCHLIEFRPDGSIRRFEPYDSAMSKSLQPKSIAELEKTADDYRFLAEEIKKAIAAERL